MEAGTGMDSVGPMMVVRSVCCILMQNGKVSVQPISLSKILFCI